MSLCDSRRGWARCLVFNSTEGRTDPCEAAAKSESLDRRTQEVEGVIQARPADAPTGRDRPILISQSLQAMQALDRNRKTRVVPQAKTVCTFHGVLRGSGFLVRPSACSMAKMAKTASLLCKQTPWRQARSFHSVQHGPRVLVRLVTKIRSKIPFFSQRPVQALPPNRQEVGGKLVPLWTRKLMLRNLH